MFDGLWEFLENFWQDVVDVLLWLPRKLFELLMEGLAELVNWIPVPEFIADTSGNLGALPSSIAYAMWLFSVPEGLAMILSAYVLRFLIRRLPFIG